MKSFVVYDAQLQRLGIRLSRNFNQLLFIIYYVAT